jgi:hypothetical protein
VHSPSVLYSRYGTFTFYNEFDCEIYRANLTRGYHSTNFPSCKCSMFPPKYPGRATKRRRYAQMAGPRAPCPYPNATLEDSPFSLHDLSILESQLLRVSRTSCRNRHTSSGLPAPPLHRNQGLEEYVNQTSNDTEVSVKSTTAPRPGIMPDVQ